MIPVILTDASKLFGVVTPLSGETQPPAAPTGISVTNGTGSITVTCTPTGDLHDGSLAAGGVSTYTLYVDDQPQTPVSAPYANVQAAPTLVNIGSVSPAPTLNHSGRQYTVTSAGNGIDGTADQITAVAPIELTGEFDLITQLTSFNGAGFEYAYAGLMVRETTSALLSTATSARYMTIYQWLSAESEGLQCGYRAAVGANKTNLAYVGGTGSARWIRLKKRRSGTTDTFTFLYSTDGGGWSTLSQHVVSDWSNTVVAHGFVSNLADSAVLTAVFNDLVLLQGAQADISQNYTTSGTVSAYWKATDATGNVSTASPAVSGTGSTSEAIKYNPGQYISFSADSDNEHQRGRIDLSITRQSLIDHIENDLVGTPFKGLSVDVNWRALDSRTTSPTTSTTVTSEDYDTGLAAIMEIYDVLDSYGMRLVLNLQTRMYALSAFGYDDLLPVYVVNDTTNYGYSAIPGGGPRITANMWQEQTANRIIAMMSVLGPALNALPRFEGIIVFGETAMPNGTGDYTGPLLKTQIDRIWTEVRGYMPNTQICQWFNDTDPWTSDTAQTWLQTCYDLQISYTNPNTTLWGWTLTDAAFCGIRVGDGAGTGTGFTADADPDWRDEICVWANTDDNDFFATDPYGNPSYGTPYQTLDQIDDLQLETWDYGSGRVQPSRRPRFHLDKANYSNGDSTNRWDTAQKAHLIARAASLPVFTSVPTMFTGGVITGG